MSNIYMIKIFYLCFLLLFSRIVLGQGNVPEIEKYDKDIPYQSFKTLEEAMEKPDLVQSLNVPIHNKEEFLKICTLKNLKILVISNVKIDSIPSDIGKLTKLQFLRIENTPITFLPNTIVNLKDLRTLYIFSCPLKKIPSDLFELTKLRTIQIDSTALTELPLGIGKTSMQMLLVGRSKLTSLPADLCDAKELAAVAFSGNKLTSIPTCINGLQKLVTISLSNNQITEIPADLLMLPKLQFLSLSGNRIPEDKQLEPQEGSSLIVFY